MSTMNPGPPPSNDAEWARETEKRLRQLESANTIRIGPWVISSQEGDLVATKPGEEFTLGAVADDTTVYSGATRGYVDKKVGDVTDSIVPNDDPTNPNGGGGIPIIKDYLSGKWDDIVEVTEVADSRLKAGNNLVSNPNFEKMVFATGDGVIDTYLWRTGTKSARLTATGTVQKLFLISDAAGQTAITCTPGDIFYVEAWVRGKASNVQEADGANGMGIYFDVFNTAGVKVGQSLTTNGPSASTGLSGQWTRFYGYITIPTTSPYNTVTAFTAYIQLNPNVTPGDVYYFDDVIIRVDSLVNSWNYIYDGSNGTLGSFGKGPFDLFNPLKNVRDVAIGASGAAGTATSIANNAASGASGALNTANLALQGATGARAFTQDFIDAFVAGIRNWTGSFGVTDARGAAQNVNQSLANLALITSNLQAQKDAGMFYGEAVNEDFTSSAYSLGATLGSKWVIHNDYSLLGYNGGTSSWGIYEMYFTGSGYKSAQMAPINTSTIDRYSRARFNRLTATQYQKIGLVILGVGGSTGSSFQEPSGHYTYIYGRMSSDATRYIFARFTRTQVMIGYRNGSTGEVVFEDSRKNYQIKSGVTYWLECGTSATAFRTFRLWEGTTVITTGTDSAAASANNTADRYSGFGGYALSSQYYPATVSGFGMYDNVPPSYRGSGFKASCPVNAPGTSTANNFNVSTASSGQAFFPNNWFSTLDYCTDDLLYDSTLNALTVSQPGWYLVTVAQKGSYADALNFSSGRVAAAVYKQTGSGMYLLEQVGPASALSAFKGSFGASFVTYLQGGDKVRPGTVTSWNTAGSSFIGSAIGETYWSVTFIHNQLTKITSLGTSAEADTSGDSYIVT